MSIIFDWLPQINRSLRESAEIKVKNDIQESDDIKPCHRIHFCFHFILRSSGGSIKGEIRCSCSKILASFHGSSDGSTLNYVVA
jgi:hypothetical protein